MKPTLSSPTSHLWLRVYSRYLVFCLPSIHSLCLISPVFPYRELLLPHGCSIGETIPACHFQWQRKRSNPLSSCPCKPAGELDLSSAKCSAGYDSSAVSHLQTHFSTGFVMLHLGLWGRHFPLPRGFWIHSANRETGSWRRRKTTCTFPFAGLPFSITQLLLFNLAAAIHSNSNWFLSSFFPQS